MKHFLTGAQVAVKACQDAGAEMMYGYPITPATEILTGWFNEGKKYLQSEDEIAAGFELCGAVMAGQKAFSATSGPGHILMQDAFSMAEGMRLPVVLIVAQRGGPSSGTVIYSQQEVTLACFGGNGEGLRLVYSPSNSRELYELTRRAFNDAWKYRFPAVVLTDGYLLKTKSTVDFSDLKIKNFPAKAMMEEGSKKQIPNIYTTEEELNRKITDYKKEYDVMTEEVTSSEQYKTEDADTVLIAHGTVASSVRKVVDELRKKEEKVGLFRPITLRPFDARKLNAVLRNKKRTIVVESSLGQLERIVKDELDTNLKIKFDSLRAPALGIEPNDIIKFV